MCETLLASRSESRVERAGFWMEGTGTVPVLHLLTRPARHLTL